MIIYLAILITSFMHPLQGRPLPQERTAKEIIHELFRLRNEHKADSAELFFADTVKVYMKYLRNVPRKTITKSDKAFWKAHPRNKFEMTAPVELKTTGGVTTAIITGKEYLDGTSFRKERIEIRLDRRMKIYYYRGFSLK